MNHDIRSAVNQARRSFLLRAGMGIGGLALMDLLGARSAFGQSDRGTLGPAAHFPAKAKRVIYLHMLGAVSQVDTFDYKPMLVKMDTQEIPREVLGNRRLSTMTVGQSS